MSRIVLEYTGQNYAQLVLRLKMERAAALLKQKKTNAERAKELILEKCRLF